jgi:hypothetical protein
VVGEYIWRAGFVSSAQSIGKNSFFEKKEQKTFVPDGELSRKTSSLHCRIDVMKVFWFFFSKKNCFLSTLYLQRLPRLVSGRDIHSYIANSWQMPTLFGYVKTFDGGQPVLARGSRLRAF